jgi:hypothetical protein
VEQATAIKPVICPPKHRTTRNVMDIEKPRVAATGDGALLVIAAPHGSARRR